VSVGDSEGEEKKEIVVEGVSREWSSKPSPETPYSFVVVVDGFSVGRDELKSFVGELISGDNVVHHVDSVFRTVE